LIRCSRRVLADAANFLTEQISPSLAAAFDKLLASVQAAPLDTVVVCSWCSKSSRSLAVQSALFGGAPLFVGRATLGSNLLVYPKGFRGNQFVTTISLARLADVLSRGVLVLGTAIDIYGVYQGDTSIGHAATNLGVGVLGLLDPFTALPAAGYAIIDNFYPGGFLQFFYDSGEAALTAEQNDPYYNPFGF
jgi:hypothetical protein